jgi:subtilisin family serine protease
VTVGIVRVAVIDSGVHASHPHVNGVSGGVGIDSEGHEHGDFVDRLGHGTAVTAVIREKAPAAAIYSVKVFDRELAATGTALVAACEWALRQGAHIVNLSLGTLNPDHEVALATVVQKLRAAGVIVVAAGPHENARWLPGSLPGVWSVTLDWSVPREECHASVGNDERVALRASGFPRPIPGVPPERNLKGRSFAVANATGLLADLLGRQSGDGTPVERLIRAIAHGSGRFRSVHAGGS